ncbi:AraC family transcriptional regulator [Pseudonocardia zijingensis]|uniref:AraC family transcriptional regulator n=1 Tax=Pseudonocardia zijingensis TaxID=153376 RepID=A0ABP3ZBQ7_9PSEU
MTLDEIGRIVDAHAAAPELPIPGLAVARSDRPTSPDVAMTGAVLAVVVQGVKRVTVGDRTLDCHAGDYLVTSVDLPVTGYIAEASPAVPYLGFGMPLDPDVVAELVLAANGSGTAGAAPAPAIGVGRAGPDLLDACTRLLRLLDRPEDRVVLGPAVHREIVWRLLQGEHGQVIRQAALPDGRVSEVRQVIHWLRENYAEPVRVEDLARRATMSVSAFHKVFSTVTAMSPIQYQKRIRLQEARRLLVAGGIDVTGAAHAVGYDSPTQFSREYRRLFGAPPRRDTVRARAEQRWERGDHLVTRPRATGPGVRGRGSPAASSRRSRT